MRANEFIRDEEKLDEILPLIGAAAGGIARAAGAVAGRAVAGLGKAAVRGAGALARGAVTSMVGKDDDEEEPDAGPNATVGVQPATATAKLNMPGSQVTPAMANKAGAAMANLKPGVSLQMPTNTGRVGDFKVTKVTANDVEIENPDKLKNPNEPDKIIYNKKDLAKVMGTK